MLSLLSECHFWTTRDVVNIKPTNLSVFHYGRLRNMHHEDPCALARKDFIERRCCTKISKHLKDNIKKLEELLQTQKLIYSQWQSGSSFILLFNSGIIVYISINIYTGGISHIVFEKYFIGKLAAEIITDAFFTSSHIILSYNTNQLTVVHLQKQNEQSHSPEKICSMDPRIFHVIIPGTNERKLPRYLVVNSNFNLFAIWTKSSQNEVYPWRPTVRDQDRANINIFRLKGSHLELFCYCWTENEPLCVVFFRFVQNHLLTIEQRISSKGLTYADICSYSIVPGKMQRISMSSILIGTEVCSFALSPDQEKLVLGTADRLIHLYDLVKRRTTFLSAEIIPTHCSWNSESSVIVVANTLSQFQCFDLSLNAIGFYMQSEDTAPIGKLSLSNYFTAQPTLLKIDLCSKPDNSTNSKSYIQTDAFLLLIYDKGPLACLKLSAITGMRGDVHNSGFTADVLINSYLDLNQPENAVKVLDSLNWDTYGAMCLISLHKILNFLSCHRNQSQHTLDVLAKSFETFADSFLEETRCDFFEQFCDLRRRFCFFLLRCNLFELAFELAESIGDYDIFMDLYNNIKCNAHYRELAYKSFHSAADILGVQGHIEQNTAGNNFRWIPSNLSTTCTKRQQKYAQFICKTSKDSNLSRPLDQLRMLNSESTKFILPKLEVFSSETSKEQSFRPQEISYNDTVNGNASKSLANSTFNNACESNCDKPCLIDFFQKPNSVDLIYSNSEPIWKKVESFRNEISSSGNAIDATYQFNSFVDEKTSQETIIHQPIKSELDRNTRSMKNVIGCSQQKFYQHPLVSGIIPLTESSILNISENEPINDGGHKRPLGSILSNSVRTGARTSHSGHDPLTESLCIKETTNKAAMEKNKVKFSDTVQVAVVPDIGRKEKTSSPKQSSYSRFLSGDSINYKKNLHENVLLSTSANNFNTIIPDKSPSSELKISPDTTVSKDVSSSAPSVKVVHFGMV